MFCPRCSLILIETAYFNSGSREYQCRQCGLVVIDTPKPTPQLISPPKTKIKNKK